jgi:hypothetical protein
MSFFTLVVSFWTSLLKTDNHISFSRNFLKLTKPRKIQFAQPGTGLILPGSAGNGLELSHS